jgi:hypothetical protein
MPRIGRKSISNGMLCKRTFSYNIMECIMNEIEAFRPGFSGSILGTVWASSQVSTLLFFSQCRGNHCYC